LVWKTKRKPLSYLCDLVHRGNKVYINVEKGPTLM